MTTYSTATPSGSFSENQACAASVLALALAKTFEVIRIARLLTRIHLNEDSHGTSSISNMVRPRVCVGGRGRLLPRGQGHGPRKP